MYFIMNKTINLLFYVELKDVSWMYYPQNYTVKDKWNRLEQKSNRFFSFIISWVS